MNNLNVGIDQHSTLLVADVHAEGSALEQILDREETKYSALLGDIPGYGSELSSAIAKISEFDIYIRGNHEEYVLGDREGESFTNQARESLERHKRDLTTSQYEILDMSEEEYGRNGILLYHGIPGDADRYLMGETEIRNMMQAHPSNRVYIGGHLHLPRVAKLDRTTNEMSFEPVDSPFSHHIFNLDREAAVINVPSVRRGRFGQPPGYAVMSWQSEEEMVMNFHFIKNGAPG